MAFRNLILLTLTIFIIACESGNDKGLSTDIVKNNKSALPADKSDKAPVMFFDETIHDFGKVIQGERVLFGFKFINIGGSDLVITRVSSSCGCTIGNYPKQPVAPGKSGIIEVSFDSKNRKGIQSKTVTVLANTVPNSTTLRIKAKVVQPATD